MYAFGQDEDKKAMNGVFASNSWFRKVDPSPTTDPFASTLSTLYAAQPAPVRPNTWSWTQMVDSALDHVGKAHILEHDIASRLKIKHFSAESAYRYVRKQLVERPTSADCAFVIENSALMDFDWLGD